MVRFDEQGAIITERRGEIMAPALLTRTDGSTAVGSAYAGRMQTQGYEVLLVCDTSGASPGNPWAVFCPSLNVCSAGSDPQDALDMIADAIYEALLDGANPEKGAAYDEVVGYYHELMAAGFPTAEAAVTPAPYSG